MKQMTGHRGTAYFVRHPRSISDLFALHALDAEQPFIIVQAIRLSRIDYDNLTTDMTVDRPFIEACAPLCRGGRVLSCLFV